MTERICHFMMDATITTSRDQPVSNYVFPVSIWRNKGRIFVVLTQPPNTEYSILRNIAPVAIPRIVDHLAALPPSSPEHPTIKSCHLILIENDASDGPDTYELLGPNALHRIQAVPDCEISATLDRDSTAIVLTIQYAQQLIIEHDVAPYRIPPQSQIPAIATGLYAGWAMVAVGYATLSIFFSDAFFAALGIHDPETESLVYIISAIALLAGKSAIDRIRNIPRP